jgi:hypothetical protein
MLRSLGTLSKEEARVIQSKGGKGNEGTSLRKSVANQIYFLKKKGITNSNIQLMLDMMENPNVSNFQILSLIQEFKESLALQDELKPVHYAMLAKLYLEWHKVVHGEKHKIEASTTVTYETNISLDTLRERLKTIDIIPNESNLPPAN